MSWSFLVHCFTIWSTEPTVLGYRLHGMWGKFLTILVCAMGPQEEAQQWAQDTGLQQLQGDWNLHSLQNLTNATNILSVSYNYLAGIPPLRKSEYHMPPTGGPGRIKKLAEMHSKSLRNTKSLHFRTLILFTKYYPVLLPNSGYTNTKFILRTPCGALGVMTGFMILRGVVYWFILIFISTFHSSRGLKVDCNSLLPSFFLSLQLPFCDIY